jgi:hypothetical protein
MSRLLAIANPATISLILLNSLQVNTWLLGFHLSLAIIIIIIKPVQFGVGIIRVGSHLLEPVDDRLVAPRQHCLGIVWLPQAERWAAIRIDSATAFGSCKEGTTGLWRYDVGSSSL